MRSSRPKITALIITFNEIGYIENCIESIRFADEIIVVDSFSTDGTYEYLVNLENVKVIQHPFDNFTLQKSFALNQATNDWVLFLDADEVVSKTLKKEILKTVNSNPEHSAYWFYRKFMFQNKSLSFSGWQTDKNYRLFRKSKAKFSEERLVHETLNVDGTSGFLKEKLIHFCYKNFEEYKEKILSYGRLKAKESFFKEKKFNYFYMIFKPAWKFFHRYILRFGILDGKKGIIICYLDSLGVLERYRELKRLELQNNLEYYLAMPDKA
ncbi:glycosyltransferase family 2 protein [uncultured Eudoraea sp.]|uniref:glycosyltransferase family 2 protein n=1 Tax=uncultured Eudoraea sp. TaxID=1035614 RepID=UPI00260832F3|nr:glycosyltransferase family 2 protein [uncultured Eudoraea sp.]